MAVDQRRVRVLREGVPTHGPVVYIMGRDFRVEHNWALVYAQEKAKELGVPLCVLVHFGKNFIGASRRQHVFMVEGLEEIAPELEELGIPLFVTIGDWRNEFKQFVEVHKIGLIVTDFSPLHELRFWWDEVSDGVHVPIHEVDAHNVIPAWIASNKQEFAAHTFRPKVKELYRSFLLKIPPVTKHPHMWGSGAKACWPRGVDATGCAVIDWAGIKMLGKHAAHAKPVSSFKSGPKAAEAMLLRFIQNRLPEYADKRNDPSAEAVSDLSPYIHFGQLSVHHIIREVSKVKGMQEAKQSFFEELIVRRELAENFCFYNPSYDSFEGIPQWAKDTLGAHREDPREYIYTKEQLEKGETHDPLWNAAQKELVKRGKMHGYMRMYWAKKILEWTKSPEEAIEIAIHLNDTYSLDGRDPNGYVGILWSIGGVHDRAWFEKPVFGKVRYMNYNGCKRKFDIERYVAQVDRL